MDAHHSDPLLADLRHRVAELETRQVWLERVVARLIQVYWDLVKPRREQTR